MGNTNSSRAAQAQSHGNVQQPGSEPICIPNPEHSDSLFTPGSLGTSPEITQSLMDMEPLSITGSVAQQQMPHLRQQFDNNNANPGGLLFNPLSPEAQEMGIPTVFEWEGGKEPPTNVYIIGSFTNWKQGIPLARSHNDFSTILYLPEGRHEYKFIVDDKWVVNYDQAVATDEAGNVNNIIEVSSSKTFFQDGQSSQSGGRASPPGEYSTEIPQEIKNHYAKKEPPALPVYLQYPILLRKPPILKPTSLAIPPHVMLNHMSALSLKENVIVLGVSCRFRNKFVTTVVYRPDSSVPQQGPVPMES
eukprot:GCRY01002975.1.p1 GENE.GCRY01002975.1~~GCRY01002975.1.p1  ORF type:complete len:304 (-),score=37.08 GCRY01002975.1:65-976(-)